MDTIRLDAEIRVFGIQVKNRPAGIGEAFNKLVNMVDGGFNRPYYGITEIKNGSCIYRAAAAEMYEGEADRYGCETYVIEKGEYIAVLIRDWRKKTESIKDVFQEMMQDNRIDYSKPFVEWYKDDDEMLCLARVRSTQENHHN